MLTERKARLDTTIEALEGERTGLVARLKAQTLTEEQVHNLQEFAAQTGVGLECADFQARRGIIENLDVRATLAVENGEKVAYVRCMLDGDFAHCIALQVVRYNGQNSLLLSARLVLDYATWNRKAQTCV